MHLCSCTCKLKANVVGLALADQVGVGEDADAVGVEVRRLGLVGGVELHDDVLPLRLDDEGRLHKVLPNHLRPRRLLVVDDSAAQPRQQAPVPIGLG